MCDLRIAFSWAGLIKVVVSGVIFMWQKSVSQVSLSVGACLSMMLASVRSLANIEIGVRGLRYLSDLSISSLIKFTIRVRKEFGFWSGKFIIVCIGWIISNTPMALRMLDVMFQTGLT